MFVDEIRRAVEASPRVKLPEVAQLLWKAYAGGSVTEAEASELSELIEARKAIPAAEKPVRRRVGSRPRSPASMERRRSWAAAGRLPPALAARFTLAEQAVLAVIAVEAVKNGSCRLAIDHIAALAGVGRSTVKRALREAHGLGLIRIEERRLTAWRNDTNVVSIISPEWSAWLRLGRKGGVQFGTGTRTGSHRSAPWRRADPFKNAAEGQQAESEARSQIPMSRGKERESWSSRSAHAEWVKSASER